MADTPDNIPTYESFLIAELGNSTTNVAMFDVVDGAYRLIGHGQAPSTLTAPWLNVSTGLIQAVANLSENIDRELLTEKGELIHPSSSNIIGVDEFAAVTSAAEPLRVILVGLLDDVSLASARRAMQSVYAEEVDSFSLSDTRTEEEQVASILQLKPDLIFIAGGTDGGDSSRVIRLVEAVTLGIELLSREQTLRPQVVYAGNRNLRDKIKTMLSSLTSLHVVENVRPNLEKESLQDAALTVGALYEDIKVNAIPGIEDVMNWTELPVVPTAQALSSVGQYFSALSRGRVLMLDVGSDSMTFVAAEPRVARLNVNTTLGMGRSMAGLLEKVPAKNILRWLTDNQIDEAALANFLQNKALFPKTVPNSDLELKLEQAAAREMMHLMATHSAQEWGWVNQHIPSVRLILLRGALFSRSPRPGQNILMLLDAIQPSGVFAVAVDKYRVLPALGFMAAYKPVVTVQSLEGGVLVDLGWVIAPTGKAQPGKEILQIQLKSPKIGTLEVIVTAGSLEVLPLPPDQEAILRLKPLARNIDVGFGPGEGKQIRIQGGSVGLVVDARGRPLQLPKQDDERREKLTQWFWDVGG